MKANLGGLDFIHGNIFGSSYALPGVVHLSEKGVGAASWTSGNPDQFLAHELGHVWDYKFGGTKYLIDFMGGDSNGLNLVNEYFNYNGKPASSYISSNAYFDENVRQGYGNGAPGDYFAETFGWGIMDPSKLPNQYSNAYIWMNSVIANQASVLP